MHHLPVERRKVGPAEQGTLGGFMQQRSLKDAGHHEGFALVEAQQMIAVNLGDLHRSFEVEKGS